MSRIEQMSKMQRDIESGAPQPTGGDFGDQGRHRHMGNGRSAYLNQGQFIMVGARPVLVGFMIKIINGVIMI